MKTVIAVGRTAAAIACAFAVTAVSGQAFAATATGSFTVGITIEAECTVASAGNISFGTVGLLNTQRDATSTLGILCTDGTPYTVALSDGTGASATAVTTRKMTGGAATIDYNLYRESTRSQIWGSSTGTNTVAATGNGATQTHTVFGRVPVHATTPAPATYSDTIQVTITY